MYWFCTRGYGVVIHNLLPRCSNFDAVGSLGSEEATPPKASTQIRKFIQNFFYWGGGKFLTYSWSLFFACSEASLLTVS